MTHPSAHPAPGQRRQVTATASVLLARNPGPLTLDGTNTWLLQGVGARTTAVVDPGPDDAEHVDAVARAANPVELIVLTHHHHDHTGGADRLRQLTGAPVLALDPSLRHAHPAVADGDVLQAAGVRLRVWLTPGHSADSVSVLLDDDAVLTGDTILGRGTTVIAEPDGDLGDYLESLRRLRGLTRRRVLPGHGPEQDDVAALAQQYLTHRATRLDEVRSAMRELGLRAEPAAAPAVVERVYADVDQVLWPAAEQSVRAQLAYLARLPPPISQDSPPTGGPKLQNLGGGRPGY